MKPGYIIERVTAAVVRKNVNSVCIHFVIISPDP